MTPLRRLAPVLLAVLLTAACAEPPRPFGRDGGPVSDLVVRPLTGTTVAVEPVQDLPEPLALAVAEALAAGLARAEVPARVTPEGLLPGDHRLFGQVMEVAPHPDSDTLRLELSLELRDAEGHPATVQTVEGRVPGALWTSVPSATPEALRDTAERLVAPAIPALAAAERALVPVPSGEPEGLARDGGSTLPPPPPEALAVLPAVAVVAEGSAPGGKAGDALLIEAMRGVLRDVGVPLTAEGAKPEAAVAAAVRVTPVPGENRELVRVVWTVRTPDGQEIGTVAQENLLPRGYAEQHWADMTYLIAGAAVDGVVPLLRRIPQEGAKPLATAP